MPAVRPPDARQHVATHALGRMLPVMLPEITEYLAAELCDPGSPEPDWSDLEWRIARAIAVIHGISPLLSQRSSWSGPEGWRTFLESQRAHTATRYGRMAALLSKIDEQAARQGIAFIPLKGEALHEIGVYAPGDRPMADIDLLVKPCDLVSLSKLVVGLGYRAVSITADEHVLVPVDRPPIRQLGEHAEHGITIELHARIDRPMPVRLVDITAQLWPSSLRPGRNGYSSLAALMAHLLMHAAVNMQIRILRMLQLHDIALLAPRLSAADWSELLASAEGGASPWWALPPLQLTEHYYPGLIPAAAIESAGSGCSPLLRFLAPRFRLSGVSASNLRRSVFPALSWVGSLPEAARCVGHRLRSGVRALQASPTIAAANELQPWITPSHRRRLLEVLTGRARPETLRVVAASLDSDLSSLSDQEAPRAA